MTVWQSRSNAPGERSPHPPPPPCLSAPEPPSRHGLTEATKNFGLGWAAGCADASMRRQAVYLAISTHGARKSETTFKGRKRWDLSVRAVLTGHRCSEHGPFASAFGAVWQ